MCLQAINIWFNLFKNVFLYHLESTLDYFDSSCTTSYYILCILDYIWLYIIFYILDSSRTTSYYVLSQMINFLVLISLFFKSTVNFSKMCQFELILPAIYKRKANHLDISELFWICTIATKSWPHIGAYFQNMLWLA